MNVKIVKALIKAVTAVAVAVIGIFAGIKWEQINTQTQINEVMGDVINVNGDANDITINDIATLTQNYIQLQSDYESINQQKDALVKQNTQYYNDLSNANKTIEELNAGLNNEIDILRSQLDSAPVLNYKNLALSIDVDDIPINTSNSMVTIEGRDYFSQEIVEKIIPDDKNITIKNGVLYVGKVVEDKANLFDQYEMSYSNISNPSTIKDSYGNNYTNVLCFQSQGYTNVGNGRHIIYVLNRKYSLLKFSIAIRDSTQLSATAILTIKADDEIVYTSESLNKKIEPFTELDIPINNCNLLTIEYKPSGSIDCFMFDAVVYN